MRLHGLVGVVGLLLWALATAAWARNVAPPGDGIPVSLHESSLIRCLEEPGLQSLARWSGGLVAVPGDEVVLQPQVLHDALPQCPHTGALALMGVRAEASPSGAAGALPAKEQETMGEQRPALPGAVMALLFGVLGSALVARRRLA